MKERKERKERKEERKKLTEYRHGASSEMLHNNGTLRVDTRRDTWSYGDPPPSNPFSYHLSYQPHPNDNHGAIQFYCLRVHAGFILYHIYRSSVHLLIHYLLSLS